MKTIQYSNIRYKVIAFTVLISTIFLNTRQATAQIDYNYGLNKSGFRIGLGVGLATLKTHYNQNPAQIVGIASLDYDFNQYFSIGLEAQGGKLKGVDDLNHQYYKTSEDQYLDANVNVRVAIGAISDYYTRNYFQDAIKSIYIGVGVGKLRTNNTFTRNGNEFAPQYEQPILQMWSFPFNVGTNIALRGSEGNDRFVINPNFQFSYVNNYYLDGFRTSDYSHLKGFYNLTTIKIKYKF